MVKLIFPTGELASSRIIRLLIAPDNSLFAFIRRLEYN